MPRLSHYVCVCAPTKRSPPFIVTKQWNKMDKKKQRIRRKTQRRGNGTSASVPSCYYHESSLQSRQHTDVLTPVRCCWWLTSIVVPAVRLSSAVSLENSVSAGTTCCSRRLFNVFLPLISFTEDVFSEKCDSIFTWLLFFTEKGFYPFFIFFLLLFLQYIFIQILRLFFVLLFFRLHEFLVNSWFFDISSWCGEDYITGGTTARIHEYLLMALEEITEYF